jgi:hypothetical protein
MPSGIPLYEDYGDIEQWVKACTSHPEFRVLPSTGDLYMSQVNTELGRAAAAPISLQNAGVRNLTVSSRAYNTPIAMSQLRGATATVFAPDGTVRYIGTGINGQYLGAGATTSYNYRTGVFSVGSPFETGGKFDIIASGEYNAEGLVIINPVCDLAWENNVYRIPLTQYPTFQNDWTAIWTIAGFNTGGQAWLPHVFGGIKIG